METKIFVSVSGGAEVEADAGAESETPTETGREIEPAPVARGSLEQPMHNGGDEGMLALFGALPASAAGSRRSQPLATPIPGAALWQTSSRRCRAVGQARRKRLTPSAAAISAARGS